MQLEMGVSDMSVSDKSLTDRVTIDRKLAKVPSRYEASALDDELVLIDVDTGKFFALKDVSLRIWNLLDEHDDLGAITDILADNYDATPTHIAASVGRFAQSLVDAGFAEYR